MLSIRWREWEGNDRKNFVLFAKQETVQMWSYTTKPINCGWKEEDIVDAWLGRSRAHDFPVAVSVETLPSGLQYMWGSKGGSSG
jgi:hypothetical protein